MLSTSGDVCPGLQSQSGSLTCMLWILRFTSAATPAYVSSMVAEPFLSEPRTFQPALVGLEPRIERVAAM